MSDPSPSPADLIRASLAEKLTEAQKTEPNAAFRHLKELSVMLILTSKEHLFIGIRWIKDGMIIGTVIENQFPLTAEIPIENVVGFGIPPEL